MEAQDNLLGEFGGLAALNYIITPSVGDLVLGSLGDKAHKKSFK